MKYIIDSIVNAIIAQKPSKEKQLRIRLTGFEDVRIYDFVCRRIVDEYAHLDVVAKLASEKYEYFTENELNYPVLEQMKENDWVAEEKSLTYYRNLSQEEAQLIILMGTEAVDDQGGLSDLYYIDPSRIVADLHGRYHEMFGLRNEEKLTREAVLIDKLYSDLFSLVPVNICKLSNMIDDWGNIENGEHFIELFYAALPFWGLCKDGQYATPVSRVIKSTRKNTLQNNYDFITRRAFRKMNKSQYKKYLKALDEYPSSEQAFFTPDWDGWNTQRLDSYEKLAEVLSEFISGYNLEKNRNLLLWVDFSIIDHILNFKLPTGNKPKLFKLNVHGNPLSALTHAIYAVAGDNDEDAYDGIKISINSVELADAVDPQKTEDEQLQLIDSWRKVCLAAGGVFDYIRSRGIEKDGIQLDIVVDPENVFAPYSVMTNVEQGIVTTASSNKKLSKIIFDLSRSFDGKLLAEPSTKCEWTFSLSDGWNHAFNELCGFYEQWCEDKIDSILPLFRITNYEVLVSAKSDEEFIDTLNSSELICDYDLLRYIKHKATDPSGQKWYAEFLSLGSAFVDCCRSIYERGFYGDLVLIGDSKINAFIDTYVKLGTKIINSTFTSGMEWVFNCFIHAFAIEQNSRSVSYDERQTTCIIPPFHPAILQKKVDQSVFLYDGCREIMLNKTEKTPLNKVCDAIDGLEEMSEIHEGVDIFPGKSGYFGASKSFSDYCICGNIQASIRMLVEGIRKKDAVYDDDFSVNSFKRLDENSRMYLDVIETYLKAMPNSRFNMAITVVNPGDLQPIVAAVFNHIQTQKRYLEEHLDEFSVAQRIAVQLHILVKPEDKGGKNYLTYWVNSFFSEDENVDVKVYLNEYDNTDTIFRLLSSQTDILFLQDVLTLDELGFIKDNTPNTIRLNECRYPIVFKPIPVMKDSVKRRIELTQKQFTASTIHSQVVAFSKDYDTYGYQKSSVTKVLSIDRDRRNLILRLHEYSNWVVCVDGGMDGALLRDDATIGNYAIIGFSTGKGRQGQYNLTITARATIIEAVNEKLRSRLKQAFQWSDNKINKAAVHCMEEAKRLDGVSLLSAINPHDYKINEFLAYVLTAAEVEKMTVESGVQVIIHLDSYPHWFNHEITKEDDSNSRPDFLLITAHVNDEMKIELDAKVIECKLAKYGGSDAHIDKARKQVEHGISRLSMLFDPESKSIRRRYWFAQLYRALSFAQITFSTDDEHFIQYADCMRSILEGNFTINWTGCIFGYWKDLNGFSEMITVDSEDPRIEYYDIPQQVIQRLLLGDENADVTFTDIPISLIDDEDDYEKEQRDNSADDEYSLDYEENQEEKTEPSGISSKPVLSPKTEIKTKDESPKANEHEELVNTPADAASSEENTENEHNEKTDESGDNSAAVTDIQQKEHGEKVDLKDVRVYIGKDRNGNKVYWEFGNPKMANRHLLITGTSGQGKTYSIQTMLKELSEDGIPAVIFDYTEGFRLDQLDPAFTSALANKLDQKIIYHSGVPINPFVRHEIELAGMKMKEKPADVAQRIANIFKHVYSFGDQQFAAIYTACRAGIEQYDEAMNMMHFKEKLEEDKNPASKTVLSKMAPFLDSVEFVIDPDFDWGKIIHSNGTVTIMQLTNFVREIQVIITEMMLWDAWHYNKKYGNKDTPFVVVLDEAQNLSHKSSSPSAMILTEGRKFGWSAWFATQSLKVLDSDEIVRLQQAAFKLYFKPTDEEITTVAKSIDPTGGASTWTSSLKGLRKGQAIAIGDRNRPDGVFGHVNPVVTGIASFEDRENETN